MTYEQSLSALKARLGPGDLTGSALRSVEFAALLISAGPNEFESGYFHSAERSAGKLIARMWWAGIPDEAGRKWPTFRVGGFDSIIADGPIGRLVGAHEIASFGGAIITAGLPEDLRDFIITACNAYREPVCEPEPWGWYAGQAGTGSQSIGPFTSREDAIKAWRADHAVEAFDVFEGRRAAGELDPFNYTLRVREVLAWINQDNAAIGGVLPRLFEHHEDDLADRLNDAVVRWAAEHKLRFVTASFDQVQNVERVPEVERPKAPHPWQTDPVVMAKAEVDRLKRAEHAAWATGDDSALLAATKAKKRAEVDLDAAKRNARTVEIKIKAPIEIRHLPPNPPVRPHTGDMGAMLDDLRRAS